MQTIDNIAMVTASYSEVLLNLVGLKIIMATHAASLRGFIFGLLAGAPDTNQWILHIQCSWHIEADNAILTGSGDWYKPDDLSSEADDAWDPAEGASLQEARLRTLFQDQDLSRRTISNNTALPVFRRSRTGALLSGSPGATYYGSSQHPREESTGAFSERVIPVLT